MYELKVHILKFTSTFILPELHYLWKINVVIVENILQ